MNTEASHHQEPKRLEYSRPKKDHCVVLDDPAKFQPAIKTALFLFISLQCFCRILQNFCRFKIVDLHVPPSPVYLNLSPPLPSLPPVLPPPSPTPLSGSLPPSVRPSPIPSFPPSLIHAHAHAHTQTHTNSITACTDTDTQTQTQTPQTQTQTQITPHILGSFAIVWQQ